MSVPYIPEGYSTVSSYLVIPHVDQVIKFLVKVFDAVEVGRLTGLNDTIMHAEVQLGTSRIMLSELHDDIQATSSTLVVYVPNVDSIYARA